MKHIRFNKGIQTFSLIDEIITQGIKRFQEDLEEL